MILILCGGFLLMAGNEGFAQWISPGKLAKAHEKLEGITDCFKCHTITKGITDSACTACHKELNERIRENKGFHARVQPGCVKCHTDHKGEDHDITRLDEETFDHIMTGYELKDRHKLVCSRCHTKENTYFGLSPECLNCHIDVHRKTLSEKCSTCHDFKGWKDIRFDHQEDSGFILTGRHADVGCELCHPVYPVKEEKEGREKIYHVLKFKPLKYGRCSDCHDDVHQGEMKEKACRNCHVTKGWKETLFNHNDPLFSDFTLRGVHKEVSCERCHPEEKRTYRKGGQNIESLIITVRPSDHSSCSDCHYDIHKGQFAAQKCEDCHSVRKEWKEHIFRHESVTYSGYKLEGKHKEVVCGKCHERREIRYREFNMEKRVFAGKFKGLTSDACSDCHYDIHKKQFADQKCEDCHSVSRAWKDNTFSHESGRYSGFRLAGKHKEVVCGKCHERSEIRYREFNEEKTVSAGKFKPVKSDSCSDCHIDEHEGKFKEISLIEEVTCENCHSVEKEWNEYTYRHRSDSKYSVYNPSGEIKESTCDVCHVCDQEVFCISCCFEKSGIFRMK